MKGNSYEKSESRPITKPQQIPPLREFLKANNLYDTCFSTLSELELFTIADLITTDADDDEWESLEDECMLGKNNADKLREAIQEFK